MVTRREYAEILAHQIHNLKTTEPSKLSKVLSAALAKPVRASDFTANDIALAVLVSGNDDAMNGLYYLIAKQAGRSSFSGQRSSCICNLPCFIMSPADSCYNTCCPFDTPLPSQDESDYGGMNYDSGYVTDDSPHWTSQLWTAVKDSVPDIIDIFSNWKNNGEDVGGGGTNPSSGTPDIIINQTSDNKLSTGAWVAIVVGGIVLIGGVIFLVTRNK